MRVQLGGDALGGYVEGVKEAADCRRGRQRGTGRVEAAQVDVQLPVGKLLGDLVREADGQGGLADPGGPGDGCDHHGGAVP